MASSGSTNFDVVTNQIIQEALELLGVVGPGDTVSGDDYSSCLRTLNLMIKTWQSQGIHLWTEQEAILFLNEDQVRYQLGGASADEASDEVIKTELSADEASGQTTLSIDSSASMTVLDNIGIELDDGTIHWTTITSIPDSTSVIINSALASAASENNNVYVYTTIMGRPLEITQARLLRDDNTTITMRPLSRREYFSIPNRTVTSTPIQYFSDYQKDKTFIYIYPASETVANRIELSYKRLIEDFDNSTDSADFPQEWLGAIIYNLAVAAAPKYFKEEKVNGMISTLASQYLQGLKSYDQEKVSFKLRPNIDYWN